MKGGFSVAAYYYNDCNLVVHANSQLEFTQLQCGNTVKYYLLLYVKHLHVLVSGCNV